MSAGDFTHDLFLGHRSKAKALVRRLAERMPVSVRQCQKVWLDEWAYAKEEAAKWSGAMEFQPLAFSLQPFPSAFGSDWAPLEAGTCGTGNLPVSNPLNQDGRLMSQLQPSAFILHPFLDAPIKGSLAIPLHHWRPAGCVAAASLTPAQGSRNHGN